MTFTPPRSIRSGFAALAVVGLIAAGAGTAGAAGPWHHDHGRHHRHRPVITDVQKACMADHGFTFAPGSPRPDFRDPAVRAQFIAALRDCGIIPAAPGEPPTTTTTTTTAPVITNNLRVRR